MREGYKSLGASVARGSSAGDLRPGLAGAGKGVNLTGGARLRDEGEATGSGRRDPKGKTYFPRRCD
jgi:hypothetical protein